MTAILEGVRVLEVAQWWFVPSAGAVLADWGADVVKIEHPREGDPQRGLMSSGMLGADTAINYMIEQPNRGKRSVGLDLKTPGGREVLYRLAERSDVFLTSFLPAARQKLQIDVEHIRARKPDIVYVRGSGQGARGPEANRPGYDGTAFWCRGGMAHMLTPRDREQPVAPRPALGDGIGGMTLAGAIAGALFRRERSGETSVVDVSLLSTAMWALSPDIAIAKVLREDIPVAGRTRPANPLVNGYRTRDGRWIQLCMLQADRDWPDFCAHIEKPEWVADARWADLPSRGQNSPELVEALDAVFAARTLAEWRERFASLKGAWAVVQKPGELHEDPQAVANGYLRELQAADGTEFSLVANPVQFDETPAELTPAPEHGQHTEEVLLELGLEWDEIAEHKKTGAVL